MSATRNYFRNTKIFFLDKVINFENTYEYIANSNINCNSQKLHVLLKLLIGSLETWLLYFRDKNKTSENNKFWKSEDYTFPDFNIVTSEA